MEKRFTLKHQDEVLATLTVGEGGEIRLNHQLTFLQLRMLPIVQPFDASGRKLKVQPATKGIALCDDAGSEQVRLSADENRFLKVSDDKQLAGLRAKSVGPGNHPGEVALELGPFQKVLIYRDRVVGFYEQVSNWLKGTPLQMGHKSITLQEDVFGTFEMPVLEISAASGRRVAQLQPIGASVIGAEGRVDLVGDRDRQSILYFGTEGPHIDVSVDSGGGTTRISHRLFKGVTVAGWYWLEDARLGRARSLDEGLFKELLRGVADIYEF